MSKITETLQSFSITESLLRLVAPKWLIVYFAALGALLPTREELSIAASKYCTMEVAEQCVTEWMGCNAGPLVGTEAPVPAKVKAREVCFASYKTGRCAPCGEPKHRDPPLTFWERFQLLGPWWIKLIPGGQGYWSNWFGRNDS